MNDDNSNYLQCGTLSYIDYAADAASQASFQRSPESGLLSAEALPENAALVDFSAFIRDYPDKLFPLLANLRPEFQELFIERYVLHKPQKFVGQCHGFVETRVWQTLRIIEQTIGAFIILGVEPDESVLRPILEIPGVGEKAN